MTLAHSGITVGEEVKRNVVPLWFPGSLGKLSNWMLSPHVTVAAIFCQAESPGFVHILQVGSVGTGSSSDKDSTSGRERFLTRRESVGLATSLDTCLLGTRRPGRILPLSTDADSSAAFRTLRAVR